MGKQATVSSPLPLLIELTTYSQSLLRRNLNQVSLYRGSRTPLPFEIKLFRTLDSKLVAVYEEGHEIEPPLLADSQVPFATIVIFRKDLNGCEGAPQPQTQTQSGSAVSVTPHPFFPWIPEYSSIASSFPKFNPDQLSTQGLGHSRKRDTVIHVTMVQSNRRRIS